jgi:hypothetical protein
VLQRFGNCSCGQYGASVSANRDIGTRHIRHGYLLVQQYGAEEAPLIAARRADALLELGDVDGQRVWKGVLKAVEELVRVERTPDERMN